MAQWEWNVSPAISLGPERVITMVLADDGENSYSEIKSHRSISAPGVPLLELDEWMSDLWITPSGALFAVGEEGRFVYGNTTGKKVLTVEHCPRDTMLNAVWASPDGQTCLVGCSDALLSYSGGLWNVVIDGLGTNIESIRGGSDGSSFAAVGGNGLLLVSAHGRLSVVEAGTNSALNAVCLMESGQVCAVGGSGTVVIGSGSSWQTENVFGDDLLDVVEYGSTLFLGTDSSLYRVVDDRIELAKDVESSSLRVAAGVLAVSGGSSFHLFDGSTWRSRTYELK